MHCERCRDTDPRRCRLLKAAYPADSAVEIGHCLCRCHWAGLGQPPEQQPKPADPELSPKILAYLKKLP